MSDSVKQVSKNLREVNLSPRQLPLGISSLPKPTFADFVEGNDQQVNSGHVIRLLREFLSDPDETVIYLSGDRAFGKTHLLMAVVAEKKGGQAQYLPLQELVAKPPEILEGLEKTPVICLDDIDAIAANERWEQALFHLFNRCQTNQSKWVVAGRQTPLNLPIELADLRSRLAWGITVKLPRLADEQRLRVVDQQAQHFGLKLSNEVKQFIIKRAPRDLSSLTELLYRLEQASLQEQKPISIRFIKNQMGW